MNKVITIAILILIISAFAVYAQAEDFSTAKQIIADKVQYAQMTDVQFELVGDYFMDLMTSSRHSAMDTMMGGDGSESLKQFHIALGKNNYQYYLQTGKLQSGMMGQTQSQPFWMMGSNQAIVPSLGVSYGMMGYGWTLGSSIFGLVCFAIVSFIFALIFWLTYKWLINPKKRK